MSRNSHKQWRRQVKKLRRKKIRQKLAEKRKIQARQEEEIRNKDPVYQEWLQQQDELEQATLEEEERIRQHQEQLWIRREIAAQKKFREEQAKEHSNMLAKEAERARIQREFEELQQKARNRLEEQQRLEEEMQRAFEEMLQKITDYIELGGPVPEELLADVQSNPNKETCPFFTKTGSCRYGLRCSRNHIRPKLGRILFFQNFFTHIQLEQSTPTEYGSDFGLEASNNELRSDYFEFFHDVTKELKKFGQIQNFRTCKNTQPHLRGNVFVEYLSEREAMKAYMELQGRYYAGKQINVEFSSITSWKTAVCAHCPGCVFSQLSL